MKKVLLIGKMNDTVNDLNAFLSRYFYMQLCSENKKVTLSMLKVFDPDLILISLIGAEFEPVIFNKITTDHKDVPVLTLGTESEQEKYFKYYEGEQYHSLIRPLENTVVFEKICERLSLIPQVVMEEATKYEDSDKKRILIVDDNAQTLRSIKSMLEDDYDVTLANSGMKAMTAIGKRRPDLILLDYEMPVCDGKQTLEMIRADEDLSYIPVIFLTGVGDREHVKAVLDLHPKGYLLKPPIKRMLLEEIEKALD